MSSDAIQEGEFNDSESSHPLSLIRLWQYCLIQAFKDLKLKGDSKTNRQIRDEAHAWIGTDDFREVCLNAGIDPDALLEKYYKGKIDIKAMIQTPTTGRPAVNQRRRASAS